MAYRNYTVDLPGKHISIRRAQERSYVYLITQYYRNKKGTPTNRSSIIGKLDPAHPGKMFPNDNYFRYFDAEDAPVEVLRPSAFVSVGEPTFFAMRLEQLGLRRILQEVFGDLTTDILHAAIYIVSRDAIMLYMDTFYENHHAPYGEVLRSKDLNELYHQITKDKRWMFFEKWHALFRSQGSICYDVTSISTSSKDIDFAERGYNRDRDQLPQVNVSTFYNQDSELPFCYELYNGSINDLSHLPTMMRMGQILGVHPKAYIMDCGYLTTNNIHWLQEEGIPFVMAVSSSEKVYAQAMREVSDTLRNYQNYLPSSGVYAMQRNIHVKGKEFTLHVYSSSVKAAEDEQALMASIDQREKELRAHVGKKERKKKEDFFVLEEEKGTLRGFARDEQKILEAFSLVGLFGILSDGHDMDSEQVLQNYRRRDTIEKLYDNMKNALDFKRLRVHSTEATEGKFFLGFIAQILYADLLRVFWTEDKPPVATIKQLLAELEKIKRVQYRSMIELMAPLTKKQKDILTLFSIDQEDFVKRALQKSGSV